MLGLVLLSLQVLTMLIGPALYGVKAFDISAEPFTEPFTNSKVWFGTDYLGRDVLAGMLIGGRATMLVGLAAATLAVTIGVTVGALAGYFGGWVDTVLSRLTELFQVLPSLLFASRLDAAGYLMGFGVGAVGAMTAFSALVGSAALVAGRSHAVVRRAVLYAASAAAVVVGGAWLFA